MGDTGSMTLGLTVAFLMIRYTAGDSSDPNPNGNILIAFSVVLVPLLDVVRVVCIRLLKRKPIFLPDKHHIHHYLVSMGISRRKALYIILLIAFGYIVFNMCFVRFVLNNNNIVLLLDLILWFGGLWLFGKVRHPQPENTAQELLIESGQP
jgi:UDP-N-acetylmuramyl pentapeptide phosphotransferase/UDP-N-acetylglucosamine-1-phosphate transferase